MTETPKSPHPDPAPAADAGGAKPAARTPEQTAKAARLATALRDNLRRRKVAHRPAAKSDH